MKPSISGNTTTLLIIKHHCRQILECFASATNYNGSAVAPAFPRAASLILSCLFCTHGCSIQSVMFAT